MRTLKFSGSALWLSVLTSVLGRCILAGEHLSARALLLKGIPMAIGIAAAAAILAAAEQEQAIFSGQDFRSRIFCGAFALWFGWELLETVGQAQTICRETFSSMAVVGALLLLLWAGWALDASIFSRSAGVLWWAAALAVLLCAVSLNGQLHWENLLEGPELSAQITLPLFAEYFAFPLLSEKNPKNCRVQWFLPLAAAGVEAVFALGMELLLGRGSSCAGYELLRAGAVGQISRFDAAFLLVWLTAALFRVCVLVCTLRVLLERVWSGAGNGQEVPE